MMRHWRSFSSEKPTFRQKIKTSSLPVIPNITRNILVSKNFCWECQITSTFKYHNNLATTYHCKQLGAAVICFLSLLSQQEHDNNTHTHTHTQITWSSVCWKWWWLPSPNKVGEGKKMKGTHFWRSSCEKGGKYVGKKVHMYIKLYWENNKE